MEDILMMITISLLLVIGYIIMKQLDGFLIKNKESIETDQEVMTPSSVMLTDDLSDEEILEEVHRFKDKHKKTNILLYDHEITLDDTKQTN